MLAAINLGKKYEIGWLFRHLNFQLNSGDVLGVIGNNGSGKSTLLKILAGLDESSEGQFKANANIGYASLDLGLYSNLTAKEHLHLFSQLQGHHLSDNQIQNLFSKVGIDKNIDRLTGKFSTGMKLRLKLALALSGNPEILLLDEPSAPLDEQGQTILQTIIAEHRLNGVVVIATNNLKDMHYATHQLCLENEITTSSA
jgi:ABC-type multidrug transport system ATPase subunit